MAARPDPAELVADPAVHARLRAAIEAEGGVVSTLRTRSLNRHGSRAASCSLVCTVARDGRARDEVHVLHAAERWPDGAAPLPGHGPEVLHWRHPHDPYLPGLRAALDPTHARRVLDASAHDVPAGAVRVRSRRYRPSRRAVVSWRLAGQDEPVRWVKLPGARTAAGRRERTDALVARHEQASRVVACPAVSHHDTEHGLVVFTHLPGTTLRQLLREGRPLPPAAAVLAVPRALARLAPFAEQDDPTAYADVTRHVRTLQRLLPERADEITRLGRLAAEVGGPTAVVHGDLHDGQLLVVDDAVTGVLDVDGVGPGLLAQDLGRLLANVEVAALRSGVDGDVVERYASTLHAGAVELAPAHDVARGAVGAWLALATGPHRVQSPTWREDTARRVDEAARWAGHVASR